MARVRLTADVDPELRRQVKIAAASNDKSVSEWIEEAVRQALQQDNGSIAPRPSGSTSADTIKPIRLRDGNTVSTPEEWEALAKKHPDIHLAPLGAKPKGSIIPIKLRGGSTMAETVLEDRGEW